MEVRILTAKDAEVFWNLRLRALQENPESFGTTYTEILERGIAGVTQNLSRYNESPDNDVTFGAFDEGTLVGTTGFRRETLTKTRHKSIIWGMYVPKELRRKGVGKALVEAAIAYARELPELEQINLDVVLTSKEARHLFIAMGFETWGVERGARKLHDHYFDVEHMTLYLNK
jgi:RimJ/RimL family protein N-acetyltransferase